MNVGIESFLQTSIDFGHLIGLHPFDESLRGNLRVDVLLHQMNGFVHTSFVFELESIHRSLNNDSKKNKRSAYVEITDRTTEGIFSQITRFVQELSRSAIARRKIQTEIPAVG